MRNDTGFRYNLKKLHGLLSMADDFAFLKLLWAVDALQSGREHLASRFISYPPAAAGARPGDQYTIHRWELESLLIQLFLVSKRPMTAGRNRILNCKKFEALAEVVQRLRNVENCEYGLRSDPSEIFSEMHRIAQRTFHWQRGYFNRPQLFRYGYLYCQGKCAEYFEAQHGVSIHSMMFTGFALFTACYASPIVRRRTSLEELGLTEDMVQRALPLLSSSLSDRERFQSASPIDEY